MFYKMYLKNLTQLTLYNSNIRHLDAGVDNRKSEKKNKIIYSDLRFRIIFWHRFIYKPENSLIKNTWNIICIIYTLFFALFISLLKLNIGLFRVKYKAIKDSIIFLNSQEYKMIPSVK